MQRILEIWTRVTALEAVRNHPLLAAVLGGCLSLDLAVLVLCPLLGGDCLYGFFSLIVFPVILSGPLGLLVPRYAGPWADRVAPHLPAAVRSAAGGRAAEGVIWVAGALALAAVITLAHMAAILFLNWFDYGGALIRPRLLQVELGLAAVYYVGLGAIACAAAPLRQRP